MAQSKLSLSKKFVIWLILLFTTPYFLILIFSLLQEKSRTLILVLFALLALSVFSAGLLALFLNKKIIKPVVELSKIVDDIAIGKTRYVPNRQDAKEIANLYSAVRNMSTTLFDYISNLEKENKTKSEFISIASHQLRTPLSAIKWLIELLRDNTNLTEEQKLKLDDIYQSNERLIRLVNDLLNVSRLEAGRMKVSALLVNLNNLVKSSIKLLQPDADSKNQKINLSVETDIKEINIDPLLLGEAINNILDNAIGYAPRDSVIDIKIVKEKNSCIISVHNEGPAIPEMEHEKLFTKFYRGAVAQRLRPTGSGLGLFIAKASVEAHGGRIWFESPTDPDATGVTFYISLPIQ